MDPQLSALLNDVYLKAIQLGHTSLKPILLDVGSNDQSSVRIYVSATEPVDVVLPINAIWLVTKEDDENYFRFLQRQSKNVSATYQHTWLVVTTYAQAMSAQTYDSSDSIRRSIQSDLDNHEADQGAHPGTVWTRGGMTMTGALFARTLTPPQQYGLNEFFPRSVLVNTVNQQTQGFYDILLGMNERLTIAEEDIIELKRRVTNVETGNTGNVGGAIEGALFYIHVVNTPETEIIIHHQLNTYNIVSQLWMRDDSGDPDDPMNGAQVSYIEVIPDSKVLFDANFIIIKTSVPFKGRIVLSAPPVG